MIEWIPSSQGLKGQNRAQGHRQLGAEGRGHVDMSTAPSRQDPCDPGGKYLLVLGSNRGSGRGGSSSPCMEPNSCLLDLNSCNRKTSVWKWRCSALTNRWQSCLMVFDLTEWFISSAFEQPIWFNFPLQCFTENDKNVLLHKACESVNEHKCAVLFTY